VSALKIATLSGECGLNIPGRTAPRGGGNATVKPDGTFHVTDTGEEGFLVGDCSNTQIQQDVTVEAFDNQTKRTARYAVPGAYWCGNAPVATNFNGSCR
jgi:hypothetical protein